MIDYLTATKKCFGPLATAVMYNPTTVAVLVLNNKNATATVLNASIATLPQETFGNRLTDAMLSFRRKIEAAKAVQQ